MRPLLQLLAFVLLFSLSAIVDAPLVANPEDPQPAPGFTVPASAELAGQALRARLALLHKDYLQAKQQLDAGSLEDPGVLGQRLDALRSEHADELLTAAAPNDAHGWKKLYARYAGLEDSNGALGASWVLLQLARSGAERASALQKMGDAFAAANDIDTALNLAAMAIAADPVDATRRAYGALLARFRVTVTGTELDHERDLPRVCLQMSRPLAAQQPLELADLVTVTPSSDVHVSASGSAVCVAGLAHGGRYRVQLHPGLTTGDGRRLELLIEQAIEVPDRTARVQFSSGAYVLARSGPALLPVRTVNLSEVPLRLYRVPERNAVPVLLSGISGASLARWDRDRLQDELGELVWKGMLDVRNARNREVVTNIPIGELIGGGKSQRGVGIYALSAPLTSDPDWASAATQWLVISNIGVYTLNALDGMHVFTRALDSAKPHGGVTVRLLARNNSVLAEARSDSTGYLRITPALLTGKGGNAPALLTVSDEGDFNYLNLGGAALDLSERGAEGRPLPGAVDAWLYSDRGIYRPGETVHVAALVRDPRAHALAGTPLKLRLTRPGDILVHEYSETTDALGSVALDLPISDAAISGLWRVQAYVDPEAPPVGALSFVVEDFVPPRLEVRVTTAAASATPGTRVPVQIDARYYYGAPGAGLTSSGRARIELDPLPFPQLANYGFDRVDSDFRPRAIELPSAVSDKDGRALLQLVLPQLEDGRHPLRANIIASVFDVGGRPVTARLALPIRLHARYVGIDPLFDAGNASGGGSVGDSAHIDSGEEARFNVIAVDAAGRPQTGASLRLQWVREEVDYIWFNSGGEWNYRTQITDIPVAIDDVRTGANGIVLARRAFEAGRYRLDAYDRNGAATASRRFYAGWWQRGDSNTTPDALTVTVASREVASDGTIKAFIRAPFAGRAQVLVANERVFERLEVELPAAGRTIEIKARPAWSPGAYLLVTAWRPELGRPSPQPARALGLAWVSIGAVARRLEVQIDAPTLVSPRQTIDVPISVRLPGAVARSGAPGKSQSAGRTVGITLAAVDEGILALTRFASPDPGAWFLGQRLFYPDARDIYGALVTPLGAAVGALRAGGDFNSENLAGLDRHSTKVVALFHRRVALDDQGRARVPLQLPDWNGRLRLMVVAWNADRVGSAETALTVRDPIVTDLLLPRFLATGDRAEATIDVRNPDTVAHSVSLRLQTSGSVNASFAANSFALAPGAARQFRVPLTALAPGNAEFRLHAELGGTSKPLDRSFEISVRAATQVSSERSYRVLAPGTTTRIDATSIEGFYPSPLRASLLLASGPALDSSALLAELIDYPYGCTEQTLSIALPQLFAAPGNIAANSNLAQSVARVLARQRSDGGFGAWSTLGTDAPWLSAYAYDVLTRARARGLDVPQAALDLAADAQRRQMNDAAARSADPRASAYAAYVLARENAAKPAEVRRFALARGENTTTRLEAAHIAAALAAIGERQQALAMFGRAVRTSRAAATYDDYGSDLRDTLAMMVLLNESAPDAAQNTALAEVLDGILTREQTFSTQELAWLAVAATELRQSAAPLRARIGGTATPVIPAEQAQRVQQTLTSAQLQAGLAIENIGSKPLRLQLSLRGIARNPPPASADGYRISRTYHDPDNGTALDIGKLRQGQRLLVVIRGKSTRSANLQKVLIADLLPAGLEIEDATLGGAGELALVPVIGRNSPTDYTSARDDRFVAALTLGSQGGFQLAYLARAVTPGEFAVPGVLIEDMVAPRYHARTAAGRVSIARP